MTAQNAFIGKLEPPSPEELSAALGAASPLWHEFIDWLATEHDVRDQLWKSVYPKKYGWSMRMLQKKRAIVHMAPGRGCFFVAFLLGDRAVAAAKTAKLPKSLLAQLAEARRYAEGTGIRLTVKSAKDLAPIRKLAEIKLVN